MKRYFVPIIVIIALVLWGGRVYDLNRSATNIPIEIHKESEIVSLDKAFQSDSTENTEGCSVRVVNAEFSTYSNYIGKYVDNPNDVDTSDEHPNDLAVLELEFSNHGNISTHINMYYYFLKSNYFILKPNQELWELAQPGTGSYFNIEVRPNCTFRTVIPYSQTSFAESFGKTAKETGQYNLVVSRYPIQHEIETSLDKGIQGKEAKKVLPTLHKTPPNGTIGGVFVCGGKSLNPGRQGMRPKSRQGGICKHGRRNQDQRHAGSAGRPSRAGADGTGGDPRHGRRPCPLRQGDRPVGRAGGG